MTHWEQVVSEFFILLNSARECRGILLWAVLQPQKHLHILTRQEESQQDHLPGHFVHELSLATRSDNTNEAL
jgi:hypothetical protein